MTSLGSGRATRLRSVLFATCATCTLWLILQNTILLTLLPQAWVPARLAGLAHAARVAVAWSVPMVLIPSAFALGWLASRRGEHAGRNGGGRHD